MKVYRKIRQKIEKYFILFDGQRWRCFCDFIGGYVSMYAQWVTNAIEIKET